MGSSTISLGLGLGGGKSATSSGTSGGTPFTNQYSVSFDGSDDNLNLGTPFQSTFASAFSISLWYKQDSATGTRALFGSRKGGDDAVTAYISANTVYMWYESNNRRSLGGFAQTSDTNWHHFCVTVQQNATSVNAKLYLDGVYRKLNAHGCVIADYTNTANLLIGARNYVSSAPDSYFSGLIDEAAIFGSALSDGGVSIGEDAGGDIGDIYNDGVPNDLGTDGLNLSPLGWWRMGDINGASGVIIADQGNGGNNGTLTNGPTYSTTVPS